MQNGSHLWQLALQKRKEGRCPLEPREVALGQVYGGHNRMAPLGNMFPSLAMPLHYHINHKKK